MFFANKKGRVKNIESTRNFVRLEMGVENWCCLLAHPSTAGWHLTL